jgi:ABC-type transport system involved in cytochrome bd biosynthesis fused ATPase/permease subunit
MLFIIMFRVHLSMILLGLPASPENAKRVKHTSNVAAQSVDDNDALITITPGM